MDFRDRTVVVTGAAGQLGRAVTSAFDAAGANLVLVERHRSHLADAFGAETSRRQLVAADLLDRDDVDRAIATAAGRFGRIDALCNIVGGFTFTGLALYLTHKPAAKASPAAVAVAVAVPTDRRSTIPPGGPAEVPVISCRARSRS